MKLVCTGAADLRMQAVSAAAKGLGMQHCVLFPGFLTDIEFAAVLGSCLGVIYPSLYEGFGMPILEAMAARRPVACSDCTSLPEVAGGAALLFDPRKPHDIADAMVRLALDPQLRADFVRRGHQRAHAFCDAKEMALQYLEVFKFALVTWQKSNSLTYTAGGMALPI
jgi:glycosyltransferase involved in cell wall biosynthesis